MTVASAFHPSSVRTSVGSRSRYFAGRTRFSSVASAIAIAGRAGICGSVGTSRRCHTRSVRRWCATATSTTGATVAGSASNGGSAMTIAPSALTRPVRSRTRGASDTRSTACWRSGGAADARRKSSNRRRTGTGASARRAFPIRRGATAACCRRTAATLASAPTRARAQTRRTPASTPSTRGPAATSSFWGNPPIRGASTDATANRDSGGRTEFASQNLNAMKACVKRPHLKLNKSNTVLNENYFSPVIFGLYLPFLLSNIHIRVCSYVWREKKFSWDPVWVI